jgi:hypothetical protein
MKALAILIVILAAPAMADHSGVPYKDASEVLVPPPQFNNQMGAKYLGTFRRVLTTHAEVQRLCNNAKALACAKFPKGRPAAGPAPACTVIMPNNLPADLYKAVNTHEVGHCMGYRH